MSQENVELVHQTVDAFNRRDLDAFLNLVDRGVEFMPYVAVMEGAYRGHNGMRRWWQDVLAVFPDWHVDLDEVRDLGDLTLAAMAVSGHGGESGTPVGQRLWQVAEWTSDGKLVRASHHSSHAEALEAAGLSEADATGR
jgi:ketosteroid isomerase-like protein